MASSKIRGVFGTGFASGSIASITLYAFYTYFGQRDELKNTVSASTAAQRRVEDLHGNDMSLHHRPNKQIIKYGIPDRGPDVRYYSNHALSYDQAKRIPVWVAEHILKDDLSGPANRKNSNFKADNSLPDQFLSENSDYKRSGWSRGHMAPAGNNKHDQESMDDTFLLSNILPQDIDNNAGFWNRFEIYCREQLTDQFEEVRVISGPLFLPNVEEDGGKKYVKYQVIGENNVAVPTHLYKLIVAEGSAPQSKQQVPSGPIIGAFIVPNRPIGSQERLADYQVPLEQLQRQSGVHFLPHLNGKPFTDLCTVDSCQLTSHQDLQLRFISRRMENATTMNRLEKSWQEVEKTGLKAGSKEMVYLTDLYKKKKKDLVEKKKEL